MLCMFASFALQFYLVIVVMISKVDHFRCKNNKICLFYDPYCDVLTFKVGQSRSRSQRNGESIAKLAAISQSKPSW